MVQIDGRWPFYIVCFFTWAKLVAYGSGGVVASQLGSVGGHNLVCGVVVWRVAGSGLGFLICSFGLPKPTGMWTVHTGDVLS